MTAVPSGPMPGQHVKDDGSIGYDKDPVPSSQHDQPANAPNAAAAAPNAGQQAPNAGQQAPQAPGGDQKLDSEALDRQTRGDMAKQEEAARSGDTGAPGGHYELRVEEVRALARQLDEMVTTSQRDTEVADRIRTAQPPTHDEEASGVHIKALRQRGQQLWDTIKRQTSELESYRNHLWAAIEGYADTDADNKKMIKLNEFNLKGKL